MNSSKWKRLMDGLGDALSCGFVVNYKSIHNEDIHTTWFYDADGNFFEEPILYRQIEWIEFPREYDIDTSGLEIPPKQDLNRIYEIIVGIGQFEIESDADSIKIIAYR